MAASEKAQDGPRPDDMDDPLLSEVIIMTGGVDCLGHLLLTMPSETYKRLCSCYTVPRIAVIIQFYLQLFAKGLSQNFAYLVDMSSWKKEHVAMLLETLNIVEMEKAGNVSILYCIQPKNWLVAGYLRRKLGFLPSKSTKEIPQFEAAIFKRLSDSARLIDTSQLTEAFGGTMTYNHTLWCQFVEMKQNIETRIQKLMERIPKAKDRVHMFLEYDMPETTTEITALRDQLHATYYDIMRDLNIEHLIDECNNQLEQLYTPTKYAQIMHTPLFNKAKVTIGENREKLIEHRSHMKWMWQEADAILCEAVHLKKYEHKADKVLHWLLSVGLPAANQEPEIADSLSKAHILKIHFETGFYAIAQNIIWLARKIEKKKETIVQSQHAIYFTHMLNTFKQFDISIKHFQDILKSKHDVYVNVYNLFTASHEVAQWYSEILRLLPTHQLLRHVNTDPGRPLSLPIRNTAIESYQNYDPVQYQLETLRDTLQLIADVTVRKEIGQLVYRAELLRKVLEKPELVTQKEAEDILRWKCMVDDNSDDVSRLLVSQSFNRANKEQPRLLRCHSRTPKLRNQCYVTIDSDSDTDLFEYMQKQDNNEVHLEQCKSDIVSAKHHHPNIKLHVRSGRAQCSDMAELDKLPAKPCLKTSRVNEHRRSLSCHVSLGRHSSCRRVSSVSWMPDARGAHSNIDGTGQEADSLSRLSYPNRPEWCTFLDFPMSPGKQYRQRQACGVDKTPTARGDTRDNLLHADSFNRASRFKHRKSCATNTSPTEVYSNDKQNNSIVKKFHSSARHQSGTPVQRKYVSMASETMTSKHGETLRAGFPIPDNVASVRRKDSGTHDVIRSSSASSKQKRNSTNYCPVQKTRVDNTTATGGNMTPQCDRFISCSSTSFGKLTNKQFIKNCKTNSAITLPECTVKNIDKPVAKEQSPGADVNSCSCRHKVVMHAPHKAGSVPTTRTQVLEGRMAELQSEVCTKMDQWHLHQPTHRTEKCDELEEIHEDSELMSQLRLRYLRMARRHDDTPEIHDMNNSACLPDRQDDVVSTQSEESGVYTQASIDSKCPESRSHRESEHHGLDWKWESGPMGDFV